MTVPAAHVEALRTALEAMCAPMRVGVLDVGPAAAPPTPLRGIAARIARRHLSPGDVEVSAMLAGWGSSLDARRVALRMGVDPAKDAGEAAAAALERAAPALARQLSRAAQASAAGVRRPLAGAALRSTAHLSIDPDAAATLVDLMGSAAAARAWLDAQMERHALALEADGKVAPEVEPVIRVEGARLHVPFAFPPLRTARGPGPDSDSPVWEDDAVFLGGSLPDGVASALRGRMLGDLVSGSPIPHRRIVSVEDLGMAGAAQTMVMLETGTAHLDEVLPPAA